MGKTYTSDQINKLHKGFEKMHIEIPLSKLLIMAKEAKDHDDLVKKLAAVSSEVKTKMAEVKKLCNECLK